MDLKLCYTTKATQRRIMVTDSHIEEVAIKRRIVMEAYTPSIFNTVPKKDIFGLYNKNNLKYKAVADTINLIDKRYPKRLE